MLFINGMWGLAEGNGLGAGACLWRFNLVPFIFICFLPIMRQTDFPSKGPASLLFHTTKDPRVSIARKTSENIQAGINLSHPKLFIQVVGQSDKKVWPTSPIFRMTQGAQISLAVSQSRCPASGEMLIPWEGGVVMGELRSYLEQTSSQACAFSSSSCLLPGASCTANSLTFWMFCGENQVVRMSKLTCRLLSSNQQFVTIKSISCTFRVSLRF